MNLTATNSSKMLTSNRFTADSEAIKGFASAPEYPAEWSASRSRPWGLADTSDISDLIFWSCRNEWHTIISTKERDKNLKLALVDQVPALWPPIQEMLDSSHCQWELQPFLVYSSSMHHRYSSFAHGKLMRRHFLQWLLPHELAVSDFDLLCSWRPFSPIDGRLQMKRVFHKWNHSQCTDPLRLLGSEIKSTRKQDCHGKERKKRNISEWWAIPVTFPRQSWRNLEE